MSVTLTEAFRYNRWANLLLLDRCAELTDKQLAFTSAGTYGSIADTLRHLVDAERWYLWLVRGAEGSFRRRNKFPGIASLRAVSAETGAALIALAPKIKDSDVLVFKERRWVERIHKSIIVTQAIHHGNDHRTHVCSILGDHRMNIPDMDVWAYGRASRRSVLERLKT